MSDAMFREAIQAVRSGQRRRARDLLTRLIKTDPNNADYWVWLSSAVETEKEQIYCLQKALQIDPNSVHARRGLVMLGALSADQANLPPGPTIDELAANAPARQATTQIQRAWASRRIQGLAMMAVVIALAGGLGYWLITTIVPQLFPRGSAAAITTTPAPTATETATPTATPTPVGTESVASACEPPDVINPARPLAAYLCLPDMTPTSPVATEQSARPEEAYQNVRFGYLERNWDKVFQNAEQAISLYKDSPYPYFYLAEAHRAAGNSDSLLQAEKNYTSALQRSPGFSAAYWGRGLTRLALGGSTVRRALDDFEQAIQASPPFLPALLARADYYLINGEAERAITDLETARQLEPADPRVLGQLAHAYATAGLYEEALKAADAALEINPAEVLALFGRGRALVSTGDYNAARDDLRLAVPYVLDPATFAELFPAANAMSIRSRPQADALLAQAIVERRRGNASGALELINQAIELRPAFAEGLVERGELLLSGGELEPAREDFNRAIGMLNRDVLDDPLLIRAYVGNGQALLRSELPNGALSNFLAAARGAPEQYDVQLGLGQASLAIEQYTDAVNALTKALAAADAVGEQSEALLARASAYRGLRRYADEASDLQAAAAIASPIQQPTISVRLTEIQSVLTPTRQTTPTPPASATARATATRPTAAPATATPRPPTPTP